MCRRITVAFLILAAVWIGGEARAEVRVVLDRHGDYRETRVLLPDARINGSTENVWTPVGRRLKQATTLNPGGDLKLDLWPALGEPGEGPHHVWAIWSQLNAWDYDLVWSRWSRNGWEPTTWVFPDVDQPGHDWDADISFDVGGRPYIVWWRDEEGQGRVYLSLFLLTEWMGAYPVSDPQIDGRYPAIEFGDDGLILVTYDTPDGTVEQTIVFDEPVTITDDIDPLDCMASSNLRYVGESTP